MNRMVKVYEQLGSAFAKAAEKMGKTIQKISGEQKGESWKNSPAPLTIDDQIDFHFLLRIKGWEKLFNVAFNDPQGKYKTLS